MDVGGCDVFFLLVDEPPKSFFKKEGICLFIYLTNFVNHSYWEAVMTFLSKD